MKSHIRIRHSLFRGTPRFVATSLGAVLLIVAVASGCSKGEAPPAPSDVAAAPSDATTTRSGLQYKLLTAGSGSAHPTAGSSVTVHYTGWTTDGEMFDSSIVRGKPATFKLSAVIAGWTEGLQLMKKGEKARFWIPQRLAYKGRDPKGTLVFDVELLSFE